MLLLIYYIIYRNFLWGYSPIWQNPYPLNLINKKIIFKMSNLILLFFISFFSFIASQNKTQDVPTPDQVDSSVKYNAEDSFDEKSKLSI